MIPERFHKFIPAGLGLLVLLLLWQTFYAVRETEFVLVTQFGMFVMQGYQM